MNAVLFRALQECESADQRRLVERAYEMHADEGAPYALTYADAAEQLWGWETITDEHARAELEAHGVCAECLGLLEFGDHRDCA